MAKWRKFSEKKPELLNILVKRVGANPIFAFAAKYQDDMLARWSSHQDSDMVLDQEAYWWLDESEDDKLETLVGNVGKEHASRLLDQIMLKDAQIKDLQSLLDESQKKLNKIEEALEHLAFKYGVAAFSSTLIKDIQAVVDICVGEPPKEDK